MLTALISFTLGTLFGMWLGTHPEDARKYGQAAVVRIKSWFRKKEPPA